MSLFSSIANTLAKIGGRVISNPLSAGSRVFSVSTPEVYANITNQTSIKKGFNANTAVYSIVMKDAKKFGSIPRYLYNVSKKEEKSLLPVTDANALTDLLNRPNKNQSQDAFYAQLRAYYKITGNAYIWLNRGSLEAYKREDGTLDDMAIDRLPVIEMIVLPSQFITVLPDPTDLWGVNGYILEAIERVTIRKGDMIHWKNTNLDFDAATREQLFGMSPLTPGAKTLEENNSMARASMRAAQNDGAKAVIYNETLGAMTPEHQSQLKAVIDAKINNTDVAGAVATLQGKWGLLDLSMSSRDQQLLEAKNMSWQELCFLFGVPIEFFDPKTTFANKEMAQFSWVTNDLIPDCKQLDGEMNRVLPKAFKLDGKVFIGTDPSELPEMRKNQVETAKVMQELWMLTPDDVREFMGFEKLGGEFAEPWVPMGRTPMSKANQDDGTGDILNEMANDR